MVTPEQSQLGQRAPQPGGPDAGQDRVDGGEFSALAQRYREAMLRIGHLEAQVDALVKRLDTASPRKGEGSGNQDHRSDMTGLLARVGELEKLSLLSRIDALEKQLSAGPREPQAMDDGGEDGAGSRASTLRQREEETAQLRLELASLSSRLAQAEGEVKRGRGERARRRSRHQHQRPKWMFWRRWWRW